MYTAKTARRRMAALMVSASLAGVLAGCSAATPAPATTSGEAGDPFAPESEVIKIGGFSAISFPMIAAETAGVPDKYGIELPWTTVESSPASISLAVGGGADFAHTSYWGVVDSINQGIELRIVAESIAAAPGITQLVVLPDSGYTDLEDLAGKKVAVVSLNSNPHIILSAELKEAGIDPESGLEFVQLPFGEMPAALENNLVDAAIIAGAALSDAVNTLNTETLFDFGGGEYEGFPEGGWITTKQYAETHPNNVAAFQCTQIAANEIISTDDEAFADALRQLDYNEEAVKFSMENAATFPTEYNLEALQGLFDTAFELGRITTQLDVEDYIVPLPENCEE